MAIIGVLSVARGVDERDFCADFGRRAACGGGKASGDGDRADNWAPREWDAAVGTAVWFTDIRPFRAHEPPQDVKFIAEDAEK